MTGGPFRRSSSCGPTACVEVAVGPSRVLVRDGKAGPASLCLEFTAAEWSAFVEGVKRGEFDVPAIPATDPEVTP